jgi:hypothetical protein
VSLVSASDANKQSLIQPDFDGQLGKKVLNSRNRVLPRNQSQSYIHENKTKRRLAEQLATTFGEVKLVNKQADPNVGVSASLSLPMTKN